MSSGRVHLTTSLVLDGVLSLVAYEAIRQGQSNVAEMISVGAGLGTFITPDYDLEGMTITEGLIRKIPVIGLIWVTLWYPYAITNPHRGRSHSVIGTLERQVYLIAICWLTGIFVVGCQYWFVGVVTVPSTWLSLTFLPKIEDCFVLSLVWYSHDLLHQIMDR